MSGMEYASGTLARSSSMSEMRSALVTGASGFLGGHLTERLVGSGIEVRGLVRDQSKAQWLAELGVDVRDCDISHKDRLASCMDGVDTVFHLAAEVGPAALPMEQFEKANVQGTRNVLEVCRRSGSVKRIVHLSSVAVTGSLHPGEVATEGTTPQPHGRYGITKWRAEQEAHREAQSGLPVVVVRPMWVYGWRSPGAVKLFQMIAHRRMMLIGRALNTIQPIAVEDLIEGLLLCAAVPGIEGQIYQMAGPQVITMEHLCGDIAAALGVRPPSLSIPMPLAQAAAFLFEHFYPLSMGKPPIDSNKLDIFRIYHAYSNDKAERELGWRPIIPFHEGARRTVAELRARGSLL
jgi:nucleoside-diphosphate-sugar epimerase